MFVGSSNARQDCKEASSHFGHPRLVHADAVGVVPSAPALYGSAYGFKDSILI